MKTFSEWIKNRVLNEQGGSIGSAGTQQLRRIYAPAYDPYRQPTGPVSRLATGFIAAPFDALSRAVSSGKGEGERAVPNISDALRQWKEGENATFISGVYPEKRDDVVIVDLCRLRGRTFQGTGTLDVGRFFRQHGLSQRRICRFLRGEEDDMGGVDVIRVPAKKASRVVQDLEEDGYEIINRDELAGLVDAATDPNQVIDIHYTSDSHDMSFGGGFIQVESAALEIIKARMIEEFRVKGVLNKFDVRRPEVEQLKRFGEGPKMRIMALYRWDHLKDEPDFDKKKNR